MKNSRYTLSVSFILLFASHSVQAQKVDVKIGSGPFYVGDSLTILVETEQFAGDPRVTVENQEDLKGHQFQFGGSGSTQSSTMIINGKVVQNKVVRSFRYSLVPLSPGSIRIGPFSVTDGSATVNHEALEIEVLDIQTTTDMKLEIQLPEKAIYPGQRVPVDILWKYAGDLSSISNVAIRSPLFTQFKFVDRPQRGSRNSLPIQTVNGIENFPAEFTRETIDMKTFLVGKVRRIMVPGVTGTVEIPAPIATVRKIVGVERSSDPFDLLGRTNYKTTPLKVVGKPLRIDVKPFPASNRPAEFRGAIGKEFTVSTSINRTRIRVGDPLTLQVNIEGDGNTASIRLPDLKSSLPPESFDVPSGDLAGIVGNRSKQFNVSLRIKSSAVTEIPALTFAWFDPETETYRSARSEPLKVDVQEGVFVSSNDVVRSKGASANEDADLMATVTGNQLDLSIETRAERMLSGQQSSETPVGVWACYLGGLMVIVIAVVDLNRRQRTGREKSDDEILKNLVLDLLQIQDQSVTHSVLREALLRIQTHCVDAQLRQISDQLDRLISEIDADAFRPADQKVDSPAQSIEELLRKAKSICRELQ